MRELWDHQTQALADLRATIAQGVRRVVLAAPTGAGKTLLAAAIVAGALRKQNRMAFVVPAIALVDQTVEAFRNEGVSITDIGVIQADHELTNWSRPVQVCSIQTLMRRDFPEAAVVVIDECHRLYDRHKTWLTHPDWQAVPFIGLSATPWTKGLGKYFETLLIAATTKELIDAGKLAPFTVFAASHPDLSSVSTVAGDYHEGQLAEAMGRGSLAADIVRTWQEKWNKDKTLCFGVNCAHARGLQERFIAAGISCGYQDAHTSDAERSDIKRKFHHGELRVVCNVGTLTTGVDWDVRCLILARPTKSEMLYVQIIGRALRTAVGKDKALILDHSDTTGRLGFVTDIQYDELDAGTEKAKAEPRERLPKECPQCMALNPPGTRVCPVCGHERPHTHHIAEDDVDLVEVTAHRTRAKRHEFSDIEKQQWHAELLGFADGRNYKSGWAAMQYKEKFGVWPSRFWTKSLPPGYAVRSWVKSRMIAYAKAKQREKEAGENAIAAE